MEEGLKKGFVRIISKRICHKTLYGKIGEIFGYSTTTNEVIKYGVSLNGKDYEFYGHEIEEIKRIKELLSDIDKIKDDQEFIEAENELVRQYCIDNNFNISKEDMNEIIQRGMEDAFDFWKEEFEKE